MELKEYLRIVRRNWLLIVVTTLLGLGVGLTVSLVQEPEYRAQSTVFVSTQGGGSIAELEQGSSFAQSRMNAYASLVTTPVVLDPAIAELRLDATATELSRQVQATVSSFLLTISVTASDPQVAAETANAIAASLSSAVESLEAVDSADGEPSSPVRLSPVRGALPPDSPSSPNTRLNLLVGGLVGAALGLLGAVVRSLLDSRLSRPRDVSAVTDRPIIGTIPFDPKARQRPLIVHDDPHSARAEAFRALRTNLQFVDVGGRSSFVITSSVAGEGKSTIAINLAAVIAQSGRSVALIDADLRKPRIATYLDIEGGAGLTDVLIGRAGLEDVIVHWKDRNLSVLPSGRIPPNPSELLDSTRMRAILDLLESEFDVVLCDAPPLLPVTDAAILAKATGGAIVVVAAGRTKRNGLRSALDALRTVGARTAGVVLSEVPLRGPDAHHAYGYQYGDERQRAK